MKVPNVKHALGEAVAALYFDDSSDFREALWAIVRDLGGDEVFEELANDPSAAYHKHATDRDAQEQPNE